MEKELTPRELKRVESDKKILDAAIKVFGEKGYGNSNLREIANVAGISQGLVSQRFGTKENLLEQAIYATGILWTERKISKKASVEDVLKGIVEQAKELCENDPIIFQFIFMISSSSDIPIDITNKQRDYFENSDVKRVLQEAQEKGYIAEGNLAVLYNIFVSNTFRLVRDYKRAGLKFPDESAFLGILQYKDPDVAEHDFLKSQAFESVSQSYFSLIYFYIDKNKYRIARTTKNIEKICNKHSDIQEIIDCACEKFVDSKYLQVVKAFMDLSTVIERLNTQKVIALNFIGADKERYSVSFIKINKEPDNRIVLCGIRKPVDRM